LRYVGATTSIWHQVTTAGSSLLSSNRCNIIHQGLSRTVICPSAQMHRLQLANPHTHRSNQFSPAGLIFLTLLRWLAGSEESGFITPSHVRRISASRNKYQPSDSIISFSRHITSLRHQPVRYCFCSSAFLTL